MKREMRDERRETVEQTLRGPSAAVPHRWWVFEGMRENDGKNFHHRLRNTINMATSKCENFHVQLAFKMGSAITLTKKKKDF